ncbi:hypothetical protein [Chitinophaga qingshengii]|uniref:DUF4369 domain-containing protein n=1 Tax=Chitinophaga qingshengii TaxID=1569794 RepID=A0ABR7TZ96_9BACT|nr:hypothetical protein [Chitinophaga qingshengii]MBC9934961.1 hypothetical protein [Chitinophaga qingshengii]
MKGIKLSLWLMIAGFSASGQQKITGIYLTQTDYLQDHPSYTATNGIAYKAKLYTFAPKKYILLTGGGEQVKLEKDHFFALQLKDGKTFSMQGGESYELLNRNPRLLLYRRKLPVAPKSFPTTPYLYYFSAGNSTIQQLTITNIKRAFADIKDLSYWLDATFRSNDELTAYDTFHHMYKLEWLVR